MSDYQSMREDIQEWADTQGEPTISYAVKDVLEVLHNSLGLYVVLKDAWANCELDDILDAMYSVIGEATGYIG